MVYVAFVVDVYAQRIVGWHAMSTRPADLVLLPLRMAAWACGQQGHPIVRGELVHHSDAGSQTGLKGSSQRRLVGVIVVGDR
jgi:putative transposase